MMIFPMFSLCLLDFCSTHCGERVDGCGTFTLLNKIKKKKSVLEFRYTNMTRMGETCVVSNLTLKLISNTACWNSENLFVLKMKKKIDKFYFWKQLMSCMFINSGEVSPKAWTLTGQLLRFFDQHLSNTIWTSLKVILILNIWRV